MGKPTYSWLYRPNLSVEGIDNQNCVLHYMTRNRNGLLIFLKKQTKMRLKTLTYIHVRQLKK